KVPFLSGSQSVHGGSACMELSKPVKKRLAATAVGLAVFLLAVAIHRSGLLDIAELKTLDHRYYRYADQAKAGKDIVLVAVDEASLEAFGRWPWPRDRQGYVVHYLKEAGAKAIVFDILFLEPDEDSEEFDRAFAEEVRAAGNVFLPILFQDSPQSFPPELLSKAVIPVEDKSNESGTHLPNYPGVKLPIPPLAEAARGLGFINLFPDQDGTARRIQLLAQAQGATFPQISAAVARYVLEADRAEREARWLRLGLATIPLTAQGDMVIDWHGTLEGKTYPSYPIGAVLRSFTEMRNGERPLLAPTLFKDKIVFVATTAAGTYDLRVTPLSPFAPGVVIHMASLDNMLRGRYMQPAPYWVFALGTLALCLGTAWSFMLLQRQTLKLGVIFGMAVAYYGLAVHSFTSHGLWMELAFPEGALAVTFTVVATVEYLTEGRQRRQLRAVFDKYM